MNTVNQHSIEQMLELHEQPVVSIYLPTHRAPTPPHVQEDKIRMKNDTRAAKEKLQSIGTDETATHDIIRQLDQLLEKEDFWQQTTEGLAMFVTPTSLTYFHLPMECDEYVQAGETANVTPLLALTSYDQPYYLLAVAAHDPVLYKGDMYGLTKMDMEFPTSPEVALNIDEMFSNSRTQRARVDLGGGDIRGGGSSHGSGDSRQAGTEERLMYFRMIDNQIINSRDIDTSLPLLLAGTQDDATDYRSNSQYKRILEGYINGNQTKTSERELHELAWPIVEKECGERQCIDLVRSFEELQGVGKSSDDMAQIEEAVNVGRVDALLLQLIDLTRDTVSDTKHSVRKLMFPEGMAETMNSLALATYRQGGKVVALMSQTMPRKLALAAVYRY